MYRQERTTCPRVERERVMELSGVLSSQMYRWMKGETERKARIKKKLSVMVIDKAVQVILRYPHWGGKKGRVYMLYHGIALTGEKVYQWIKVAVGWCVRGEVKRRGLLPAREGYEHYVPARVGDVWSADFTSILVESVIVYVSVVRDNKSLFYLGFEATLGAGVALVLEPLRQAIAAEGAGIPREFHITDHGSQYLAEGYEETLRELGINHKLIPPGEPWYNGVAENGMKTLKNHFYRSWYGHWRKKPDVVNGFECTPSGRRALLQKVKACLAEVIQELNTHIPCPSLGGVTPQDVHFGKASEKKLLIETYKNKERTRMKEKADPGELVDRKEVPQIVRKCVDVSRMTGDELVVLSLLLGGKPVRLFNRFRPEGVG